MRLTTCDHVVALMLAMASASACAASETSYKCQQANGRAIYSDVPCDVNNSKGVKRLEADAAGRRLKESNYHAAIPAPPIPDREARREEPKRDTLTDVQASQ